MVATFGILLAAQVSLASRVVLPEKYARDPGAGFALVVVSDLADPTDSVRAFADDYQDAVFVCAAGADRTKLLQTVFDRYRVFRFPRGRIDLTAADLARNGAKAALANYVKWGRYQIETPKLTRYGARLYRQKRTATPPPHITVPSPWRILEGDDGETGCDSRLAYFTIEADGAGLPPPEVVVSWPGVEVSSVDGASDVRVTPNGFVLKPTARSGGANYLTMVTDGSIELALHHHVDGAQHGPYGGRPLPWRQIRASDNWRAACWAMFRAAGLGAPAATGGASIKLYGFDSNFPRRHVDHPEHFHVMLEWDRWTKNNVGHYTLDGRGFICGNNFLVCGDIAGGLSAGYHPQKPGETTDYVGPNGKPCFSLEMLPDGSGLILHRPGSDTVWRARAEHPTEAVAVESRGGADASWTLRGVYSVSDDTEKGRYVISCVGGCADVTRTIAYSRDTGTPVDVPWIGDGESDRVGAAFYEEDAAAVFTASFVLPAGQTTADITIACAGYYALALNGRSAGVSQTSLMPLWSPFDHMVYSDSVEATNLLPYPQTNVVMVTLGNGFYNLPPLRFWGSKCFREMLAHGRPCFRLTVSNLSRPLDWTCRKTNILKNCVYLGTEIDATRPPLGPVRPAVRVVGPRGVVVPRRAPPVDFICSVRGTVTARPDGRIVVDFGANLSGVPRFVFANETRGQKIEIVYGERLAADGSVNVLTQTAGQIKRSGRGGPGAPDIACQRDAYVCGGAAEETFEPPFTWHICRYAEIRGAKNLPKSAMLKLVSSMLVPAAGISEVASDLKPLHEICVRTFRNNLIGVQSDCPGRERLGYGGDIVATCEAMCLNFDMLEFYLKTLQDFADEAVGDGWITETAPFVGIADVNGLSVGGSRRRGPISWALAVPVLMETLLRHYPSAAGRILAYYPTCARYVRLMAAEHPSGLVPTCIGDHEALERAPNEVTATAHYHEFIRLTAAFARRLGRTADVEEFVALAARVKAAFQQAYVKEGVVANGTQSAQAIGLFLGLVPDVQVAAAERQLVKAVEAKDFAPATGIFSTRYMLMYLAEHGRNDLARKIVLHRGFPGWWHMLERGATTLWETWRESDDVYSNCHPMFGSVDEWILKYGKGD